MKSSFQKVLYYLPFFFQQSIGCEKQSYYWFRDGSHGVTPLNKQALNKKPQSDI